MRLLRKISLILSLLFFLLSSGVVLLDLSKNYYIVINHLNSNQITAIFSSLTIVFFLCYLLLGNFKKVYAVICSILLSVTAILSIYIAFAPEHKYTTVVSEDGKHVILVEEKTTSTSIYIRVYEETKPPLYHSKYAISLSKNKFGDSYQYGDFDITFEEKLYKISVPLYSKHPSVVPYHKKSKTSE